MSSELPSSSGRSVFSVFSFGSSHYSQDDDFNFPLEAAPESFDASNSLTALTKKKKKIPFTEDALTSISTDDDHSVPATLPAQSELVIQSFCQPRIRSNSAQHPPSTHNTVRRYSTSQEEADDVQGSGTEVLTKFSNTLTQTAYMLTKAAGSNTNIYNSHGTDSRDNSHSTTLTTPYVPALSRVKSSPHLPIAPSFLGSPQKESLLGSEIMSQYLRRHQSQNDLLEVAEYKMGATTEGSSTDISNSPPVADLSAIPKFHEDRADAHAPGFSLLSRTRQFGAWLTKATEGEKVEVTKTDLNVLAPTSF